MECKTIRLPLLVASLASIALLSLFNSCGLAAAKHRNQGIIHYSVRFPYDGDKIITELLPSEMTLAFDESHVHGQLSSVGGLVTTQFIADRNTNSLTQYLKSFDDRFYTKLTEKQLDVFLTSQYQFRMDSTSIHRVIAGLDCVQTVAHFLNDSLPPVDVFATEEIQMSNPNWWTPFRQIDGFLMQYDIEQYGFRMRLEATSVEFRDMSDHDFNGPEGYTEVSLDELNRQVNLLIGNPENK